METPNNALRPAKPRPWDWLHILSLDAPIAACAWQWALAHHHHLHLPPAAYWGLALAAWGIYILDRTLDGYSTAAVDQTARHDFYRNCRAGIFFGILPAITTVSAYLALWQIPEGLLWHVVAIAIMVTVYLASFAASQTKVARDLLFSITGLGAIILLSQLPISGDVRLIASLGILAVMFFVMARQFSKKTGNRVPKEIAAGVLFAMGCTAAIRFYAQEENILPPLLETALMSGLFICNLASISEAEHCHLAGAQSPAIPTAKWLSLTAILATLTWLQASRLPAGHHLQTLALVILAGSALLAFLRTLRQRLHPDSFRSLADLAVVLPLAIYWL
ncbi:MAG: hypothetical protein KDK97_09705 [Verrucomicrobiales bacterium]|nr:hypothetical protein [Verrucomicrobiales bacterium]